MMKMGAESIRLDLVRAAIRAAWENGCPVANVDALAPLALRRWCSSEFRGVDRYDRDARVRDLASGLIEALEPAPRRVGPLRRDYEWLAGQIADAIWSIDLYH
jgi:hypothetical protein